MSYMHHLAERLETPLAALPAEDRATAIREIQQIVLASYRNGLSVGSGKRGGRKAPRQLAA
jgi:hypothetical protein